MVNITLTVDEHLLKRARIKALQRDTSVNAAVRDFLERFAGEYDSSAALTDFLRETQSSTAGRGGRGRTWRREDLYAKRVVARD